MRPSPMFASVDAAAEQRHSQRHSHQRRLVVELELAATPSASQPQPSASHTPHTSIPAASDPHAPGGSGHHVHDSPQQHPTPQPMPVSSQMDPAAQMRQPDLASRSTRSNVGARAAVSNPSELLLLLAALDTDLGACHDMFSLASRVTSSIPKPPIIMFSKSQWVYGTTTMSAVQHVSDCLSEPASILGDPATMPTIDRCMLMAVCTPSFTAHLQSINARSLLTMRLFCFGRPWGYIQCHSVNPVRVPFAKLAILSRLCKQIASSIESLILRDSLQSVPLLVPAPLGSSQPPDRPPYQPGSKPQRLHVPATQPQTSDTPQTPTSALPATGDTSPMDTSSQLSPLMQSLHTFKVDFTQPSSHPKAPMNSSNSSSTSSTDKGRSSHALLSTLLDTLLPIFSADAATINLDNVCEYVGSPDQTGGLVRIQRVFQELRLDQICMSRQCSADFPAHASVFGHYAGALYIPVSSDGASFLVFLRRVQRQGIRIGLSDGPVPPDKSTAPCSYPWDAHDERNARFVQGIVQRFAQSEYLPVIFAHEEHKQHNHLLNNVSHKILTPLNAIINFLEIMMEEDRASLGRHTLDTVKKAHEKSLAVNDATSNLLHFVQLKAGMLTFRSEPFDLHHSIHAAFDQVLESARSRRVRWTLSLPAASVQPKVIGDREKLRQIILRLCEHAFNSARDLRSALCASTVIDHVTPQSLVLRICVTIPSALPSDAAELRMSGIMLQDDPFGNKMDLAVVAQLAKAKAGERFRMWTESLDDGRVRICVTPSTAASTAVMRQPLPSLTVTPVSAASTAKRPLCILVAEDNPINQQILTKRLRMKKHTVLVADDGLKCIEMFQLLCRSSDDRDCPSPTTAVPRVLEPASPPQSLVSYASGPSSSPPPPLPPPSSRHKPDTTQDPARLRARSNSSSSPTRNTTRPQLPSYRSSLTVQQDAGGPSSSASSSTDTSLVSSQTTVAASSTSSVQEAPKEAAPLSASTASCSRMLSSNCDLILMDVQMPNCSGLEATRRIRDLEHSHVRQHTPIIGVSANVSFRDREDCKAAGMDGFIPKPIDFRSVDALLDDILHRLRGQTRGERS
ncbi:hypothetical protein BC831DRAFT_443502, partial [Entophlyctis helioformis]